MPAAHAANSPAYVAANRTERAIVRVMNHFRRRRGLRRLYFSPRLTFAAGLHSYDLASHGTISHAGSDGSSVATRVLRVTRARVIGETIIAAPRGRALGPRTVVRAWLHSPPHRRELLSRRFRRVGVARVRGPYTTVITADFASAR